MKSGLVQPGRLKMREVKFSVPSTGTVLGFIAVLISLGGVAYAAGALVTVGDPVTTQKARVAAGRLGVFTDLPVTTRSAPPPTTFHVTGGSFGAQGCIQIVGPPAGKALVVRQARVNIFGNPTPGPGQALFFYNNATCTGQH